MSNKKDPTKPVPDEEKFKPQNVTGEGLESGREDHAMKNVARGSEGDRRRSAQHRRG